MTETAPPTAQILEGRNLAKERRARLKSAVAEFTAEHGVAPGHAVVLVGNDPASLEYTRVLGKTATNMGMTTYELILPANITPAKLAAELAVLNANPTVHGISLQWPLPPHISLEEATAAIDPRKDVEGYHPLSTGRLFSNLDSFVPATPLGGMVLLEHYGFSVAGKICLVIGRGVTVGRPLVALLLAADATVLVAHSRTPQDTVNSLARQADFIFAAAGKPKLITGEMIKPGAVVVDFGVNVVDDNLVGDVDFESVSRVAGAVTPTPGGTGPVTTVVLLENVLKAARQQIRG